MKSHPKSTFKSSFILSIGLTALVFLSSPDLAIGSADSTPAPAAISATPAPAANPAPPAPPISHPAAILPPPIADGENMIKNPSFENPPASYYWHPNNWAKNEVDFALDPNNPHSGKLSQRIGLKKVLGTSSLEFNSPALPVRPGMALKLSFWTRGSSNSQPITVKLRKANAPYTVYFQASVALQDAWTESSFSLLLPPNVSTKDTSLQFALTAENTYWLDDVSLASYTPPELPMLVGNQIRNGSFEVGLDHWYAGFREFGDHGLSAQGTVTAQSESDAPNGQNVVAINVPFKCQVQLTSAYFPLRAGHPYSLRFWFKAPKANMKYQVSLGQGKSPNQILDTQTFVSTDNAWDFYHFEFTPTPSGSGTYFVDFADGHTGRVDLDGVSMTEGDSADAVYPSSTQPDIGWLPSPTAPAGNLFYQKDKISFPLAVAATPGTRELRVRLRMVDYRDREVNHWDVNVPLDAQGEGTTDVPLRSDHFGGFKVEAYLEGDGPETIPQTELLYSVVRQVRPLAEIKDSFFGGHVNLTPYNLDIAERLGMRWLRLHPPLMTKWMMVEPEKGKFDFYTDSVSLASNRGFHLLGLFDTAPWFYADAPDVQAAKNSAWYRSWAPGDWDAWRAYVQKTAAIYAPYIQNWEIWNEPDGGFLRVKPGEDKPTVYVKIVTETRRALDEAGDHVYLVGNAAADVNRPFTIQELKLGGGALVDAISFHLYTEASSPDESHPPLAARLAEIRQYPSRSGKAPDLWLTEGGIWLSDGRSWLRSARMPTSAGTTIADAANTVARDNASLKALGLRHYFFYAAFATPCGAIIYRNESSGIVDTNGIPHAAGAAYAASVYFLEGSVPIGLDVRPAGDGKVTLAQFHTADSHITVLWTRSHLTVGDVPGLDWQGASAYDLMGNPLDLSAKTPLGLDPVYMVKKDETAASATR